MEKKAAPAPIIYALGNDIRMSKSALHKENDLKTGI